MDTWEFAGNWGITGIYVHKSEFTEEFDEFYNTIKVYFSLLNPYDLSN